MFVPCPHCGFLISLMVAPGGPPQRCPRCEAVLPGETDETTVAAESPPTVDADTVPSSDHEATAAPPVVAPTPTAQPRRRPRKRDAPSFVRVAAPARAAGPRWPGRLAVAVLAVLLALQLVLAQRHKLAASERWRPLIGGVCTALRCDLPPWHEPAAYTMLARSVQPSGTSGVLSVTATFRNDARWPQPWPALLLSLSDVNGQPVAQRVFESDEYRGVGTDADADAATATATELAPGQSASVRFEVVEPAPRIVAFTFDFR